MTWFGGTDWVPRAFRKIESTTEIFTNDVSMITTKGASDSAARTMTIMTGFGSDDGNPPPELDRVASRGTGNTNSARARSEWTTLLSPSCEPSWRRSGQQNHFLV